MAGSIKINRLHQPDDSQDKSKDQAKSRAELDAEYAAEYAAHKPADLRTAAEKKAEINKKKMLEALDQSEGMIMIACRNAGISPATYYTYKKDDPVFAADVDELLDFKMDTVEANVIQKIKSDDENVSLRASKIYLDARAKSRGYGTERRDMQHSGTLGVQARVVTYLPDNGRGAKLPDTTVPPEVR